MSHADPRARILVVARHAEAAAGLGLSDARRPLTERGRRDAVAAGRELVAIGAIPDLVLCSPARRAKETWSGLSESLREASRSHSQPDSGPGLRPDSGSSPDSGRGLAPDSHSVPGSDVEEIPRIYAAGVESLFEVIGEVDEAAGTVLLVGHNPAVYELVLALSGERESRTGFVPGAFAVIRLSVDWADVAAATGDLVVKWAPRGMG